MWLLSPAFDSSAVSAGGDDPEALKLSGGLRSKDDDRVVPDGGEIP